MEVALLLYQLATASGLCPEGIHMASAGMAFADPNDNIEVVN